MTKKKYNNKKYNNKKYNNKKYNRRRTKKRKIQVGGVNADELIELLAFPKEIKIQIKEIYADPFLDKKKKKDVTLTVANLPIELKRYLLLTQNIKKEKNEIIYKYESNIPGKKKLKQQGLGNVKVKISLNKETLVYNIIYYIKINKKKIDIKCDIIDPEKNYFENKLKYLKFGLPLDLKKLEISSLTTNTSLSANNSIDNIKGIYKNEEKIYKIISLNEKINTSFSRKYNLKLVKNYYNDLIKYFNDKENFNTENIFIKIEKWSIMNDEINDPNEYFIMVMDRGLPIELPRNISKNSTNEETSEEKHILTLEDLIKITEKVDKLNNTYKIIHGDLKLDNMIFDKKMNEIIFIDFEDTITNVIDIDKKKNSSNLLPKKPDCIVFPINQIIIEMGSITNLNPDNKMVLYICMLWKLNHNLDKDYDFDIDKSKVELIKKLKKILKGELLGQEDIDIYELLKQLQGLNDKNFVGKIKEFLKTPKYKFSYSDLESKLIFTLEINYSDLNHDTLTSIKNEIEIEKTTIDLLKEELLKKDNLIKIHDRLVNKLKGKQIKQIKQIIKPEIIEQKFHTINDGMDEESMLNMNTYIKFYSFTPSINFSSQNLEFDTNNIFKLLILVFGYIEGKSKYPSYYFSDFSTIEGDSFNLSGGFKKNKSKKKNKRLKKNKKYSKLVKK